MGLLGPSLDFECIPVGIVWFWSWRIGLCVSLKKNQQPLLLPFKAGSLVSVRFWVRKVLSKAWGGQFSEICLFPGLGDMHFDMMFLLVGWRLAFF